MIQAYRLQKRTTKTHSNNALQKRTAKTHCKNALQKCTAIIYLKSVNEPFERKKKKSFVTLST